MSILLTGKVLESGAILTPRGRLSYPNFYTPRKNKFTEKMEYTSDLWFPPEADLSALKQYVKKVAVAKFGDKLPMTLKDLFQKSEDIENAPVPENWTKIYVKNEDKPSVIDGSRAMVENRNEVYGGRWARISIRPYAFDKGKKGVTFYLNNVQLLEHDEVFGGGTRQADARDEFDELTGADGAKASTADDLENLF